MKKDFNQFLQQLQETNATLSFWTDFDKVNSNISKIKISLHTLNYLVGHPDLQQAIKELWQNDKRVFEVLPILIAVRKRDNKKVVSCDGCLKLLYDYMDSCEGVIEFVYGTGLADLFENKLVTNLVDYVFGVEVGLDTNGRKNRSGKAMEKLVSEIFDKAGVKYRREVNSTEFPLIHAALNQDKKRFDFVVATAKCTYLIEANFYSSSGSKPNETARAYTEIGPKIDAIEGYKFVWITDGCGWLAAKSKLEAAYETIPLVFSITDIQDFINILKGEGI